MQSQPNLGQTLPSSSVLLCTGGCVSRTIPWFLLCFIEAERVAYSVAERVGVFPEVFIIQNGSGPWAQWRHTEAWSKWGGGHKSSSHRAELFTWGFIGVSELLSYCHSFLYGCFCSSHTHTHLTDAQLSSNPCCSALTQLSPTQEERTKVWRCVLWNIWWDMQDVCPSK